MRRLSFILAASALLVLTACGGDDDGVRVDRGPEETSFASFVTRLIEDTSDTADPVAINDRRFRYDDRDNPNAYDNVIR